jgi:hypothetical protein
VAIADQLMGAGVWRRGLRPPNPKFGETDDGAAYSHGWCSHLDAVVIFFFMENRNNLLN